MVYLNNLKAIAENKNTHNLFRKAAHTCFDEIQNDRFNKFMKCVQPINGGERAVWALGGRYSEYTE